MSESRSNEINFLKFIAIVCVILIHDRLPGTIGNTVRGMAAVAVPIFFMISGYFSYGVSSDVVLRRAKRTFGMLILANFIYFIWDICVELITGNPLGVWFAENCSIKRLLVLLLTNESSLRGHLWFLGALLYAYLFLFCVMKLETQGKLGKFLSKNKDKLLFVLSVFLLLGNVVGGEVLTQLGKNIQIPYIRNWLFCGIPFFCIAYCMHSYEKRINNWLSQKKLWIVLLITIVFNLIEVNAMQSSELYFTTIFVAITVFILGLQYRGSIKNDVMIFLGNMADKYGLWIYILQIMVIKTLKWSIEVVGMTDNVLAQWGSPLVSLVLTWLLSMVPISILNSKRKSKYPNIG